MVPRRPHFSGSWEDAVKSSRPLRPVPPITDVLACLQTEDKALSVQVGFRWGLLAHSSPPPPPSPSPPHSLALSSRPCAPHPSRHPRTEPPHVRAAFVGSNYIIASRSIRRAAVQADGCLPADRRFWTGKSPHGRSDGCAICAAEPFLFCGV